MQYIKYKCHYFQSNPLLWSHYPLLWSHYPLQILFGRDFLVAFRIIFYMVIQTLPQDFCAGFLLNISFVEKHSAISKYQIFVGLNFRITSLPLKSQTKPLFITIFISLLQYSTHNQRYNIIHFITQVLNS